MRALSYDQAKELWGCSDALAELNFERVRTMDLRAEGALTPAVVAYEGIQYQHLAPRVMDEAQLAYVQEHLRILSGFYGVLRPLDGVVPYRLEMQAKLAAGDAPDLYAFWGDRLYRTLADETDVIVNLASVEYAKAVLPHAKAAGMRAPRIVTCLFGTIDAQGRLKQRATAAKAARRLHGALVRRAQRPASRGLVRLRPSSATSTTRPFHRRLPRVRAGSSLRDPAHGFVRRFLENFISAGGDFRTIPFGSFARVGSDLLQSCSNPRMRLNRL